MNLEVQELKPKDVGRGIGAIPKNVMKTLGVSGGDYLLVENTRTGDDTVVRAFEGYSDDTGKAVINIDGEVREIINVEKGDNVRVSESDIPIAKKIGLALPESFDYKGDIEPYIHTKLHGTLISEGQTVSVQLGFSKIEVISEKTDVYVVNTDPTADRVLIGESTNVVLAKNPLEHYTETDQETVDKAAKGSRSEGITYDDIGGMDDEISRIREMIEMPLRHPQLFQRLGIDPPKGVLLHGPPGTGKTMIAKAIANEVNASFHDITGPEVMNEKYGKSEEKLREIFNKAEEESPSIIFMDEIDSLAPQRDGDTHEATSRLVGQLLTLMDGIDGRGEVMVIGATNRPDTIDPALRRGGRFDREIEIGVPDKEGREEILHVHTRNMPIDNNVSVEEIAKNTHGFVGADLDTVTKEAAMNALRRHKSDFDINDDTLDTRLLNLEVTDDDFDKALAETTPSAMREVFVETPDVSWDDVGGLDAVKQQLQEAVQWPIDYGHLYDQAGLDASTGILMYGPPGTGKTLMAKAAANESDANFISIDGPEVMSKWTGEAEEKIREVFEKARSNSPAVVFFDEIDSIASQRGEGSGSNNVTERIVSQLLTEMDGLEELEKVVVIGTTNRPDLVDSALRRSGRFSKEIEVGVPEKNARKQIFDVHLEDRPVSSNVTSEWLAKETDGYVGADIEEIVNEAARLSIRQFVQNHNDREIERNTEAFMIDEEHFERALESVESSVEDDRLDHYEGLDY